MTTLFLNRYSTVSKHGHPRTKIGLLTRPSGNIIRTKKHGKTKLMWPPCVRTGNLEYTTFMFGSLAIL